MKASTWQRRIKTACEQAGTYRPYFDSVIITLAGILERRDIALKQFEESGGQVMVTHINKGGAENLEQNPALRAINDMNRDALAYWRDLGLTPAGLKRINEDNLKGAGNKPTLGSVLREIGL